MKNKYKFLYFLLGTFLFISCNQRPKQEASLIVPIYCDDDFRPVISSEIDVYEAMDTARGILPIYGNEKDAFTMLSEDSVRLIVVSRPISEYESKKILDERKLVARNVLVGYDAIAVIVNKNNTDTLITTGELKKIFTGEITEWNQLNPESPLGRIQPVFNNPSSGTVRYAKDSICQGEEFSPNVKALNSNMEVLEYVTEARNALGIIGISWISNERDSLQLSFSDKISVMNISRAEKAMPYNSFQPFQYYIKTGEYPLIREMYIVHTDPYLGTEKHFADFVAREKGQLIIKNAGLLPVLPTTTSKRIRTKDSL